MNLRCTHTYIIYIHIFILDLLVLVEIYVYTYLLDLESGKLTKLTMWNITLFLVGKVNYK